MEVKKPPFRLREKLSRLFLKEPKPLSEKRDANWQAIIKVGIGVVVILVAVLLLLPTAPPSKGDFTEKSEGRAPPRPGEEVDPSEEAINQIQRAGRGLGGGVPDLNSLMNGGGGGASAGSTKNMNTSMILVRGGLDSRTQLAPGAKFLVKLAQRIVVSNQNMPVIGLVSKDVTQDSDLAIPEGSKLLGEAAFNDSTERATISWHQIILPDGRQRELGALGVGRDGQPGIEGNVHSEALKNTIGQTVSRFVGAYAEGSITRTQMGQSAGGSDNGFKNAIAETAKDRAQAWAEDLKKPSKWIELNEGTETIAILNQAFTFRDPGSIR